MTMQIRDDEHPLSTAHYQKVICRGRKLQSALLPLWGISWNLRGRSLFGLGSASMMALSYHTSDHPRGMIELLCVGATTDPETGSIHYSNIRMAHDFSRNPRPGGRKRVLDPRDEGTRVRQGDRPNASWVRLGLEVDRMACRAVANNWRLPAAPVLPVFYAGFNNMSDINMEMTPALLREIAFHMEKPIKAVERMNPDELMGLARAHWPELWRSPDAADNDTGLWLINTAYITQFQQSARLFEDFTGMLGVECWNPAREIHDATFANPVRECAEENGINLDTTLVAIEAGAAAQDVEVDEVIDPCYSAYDFYNGQPPTEPMSDTRFTCSYDEAVENLLYLRNCVRGSLGVYSAKFSDAEINFAVTNPDAPLLMTVNDPWNDMVHEDAVRLARQQLQATRPLLSLGTTDEDLAKALENPQAPLYASRMCGVQIMRRDTRMLPEQAFSFTPAALERDRVYAHLWAGEGWIPGGAREQHARVNEPEHVTH